MRGGFTKGAAAFAFASAMGVKQLIAELEFQKFLKASEFVAAIGLDEDHGYKSRGGASEGARKVSKFQTKTFPPRHSRIMFSSKDDVAKDGQGWGHYHRFWKSNVRRSQGQLGINGR